jgi:hypothetical protein
MPSTVGPTIEPPLPHPEVYPMTDQTMPNNLRSVVIAMLMTVIVVGTALAVAFR